MKPALRHAGRLGALVLVCFVALQLTFAARIALMRVLDPQSTTFQRSEIWRLLTETGRILLDYLGLSSAVAAH